MKIHILATAALIVGTSGLFAATAAGITTKPEPPAPRVITEAMQSAARMASRCYATEAGGGAMDTERRYLRAYHGLRADSDQDTIDLLLGLASINLNISETKLFTDPFAIFDRCGRKYLAKSQQED